MNADGHLWEEGPESPIERESRGLDLSLVLHFSPSIFCQPDRANAFLKFGTTRTTDFPVRRPPPQRSRRPLYPLRSSAPLRLPDPMATGMR
jgi:hypothetical protein